MYVPLSGGYASFYVSGQLLVASDGDNSFCSGYLHAQVKLVDHCFKLIDESSAEDCEVGVVHFYHIEGYMLRSGVGSVPEGYMQCNLAQGVHPLASEVYERDIRWL